MNKLKIILILLGLLALLQLGRAFSALFSPVVIDYAEMMVGAGAEQLRSSGQLAAIYAPPAAPYGMPGVQYPPLFILLADGLISLSGFKAILAGRLLSWTLYLASGGLASLIVWQETRQRWAALSAAILPFCFWSVIIFLHATRVDSLALFFSLLAAYLYRRQTLNGKITLPTLALVALLGVAAFFSKQTYLAVSAAIFFDLGIRRQVSGIRYQAKNRKSKIENRRSKIEDHTILGVLQSSIVHRPSAILFAVFWLFWAGVGFGVFGWWSRGELFGIYDPARAGSFIFHLVPGFVGFFILDHLALIVMALMALRGQWRQKEYFWPLYTLFAALACVTIIKDGAVDYYFNELAYVLAISAGLGLGLVFKNLGGSSGTKGQAQSQSPLKGLINSSSKDIVSAKSYAPKFIWGQLSWRQMVTFLLAIQAVVALGMFLFWSHWRDLNDNQRAYEEGLALVRTAQAEETRGEQPSLVLVNSFLLETGRADLIGDYFIYSVLLKNGKRDMRPFVTDLQNGRYRRVITEEFNRWPSEVETALANRYNLHIITGEAGRKIYWVYSLK